MNEGLIPKRYAKALMMVAKEKNADSQVYEVMKSMERAFEAHPELSVTLNNPYISAADKKTLVLTAADAKGTAFDLIGDFVKLLEHNKRIGMMRLIAIAYVELFREENHIYNVVVTSAAPLSASEESRLKEAVGKHLRGGSMEYSMNVAPELIGGFTVSVGNERIDASVSNELKQMRLNLLSK